MAAKKKSIMNQVSTSHEPCDRIDLKVEPKWHARVMSQAERLGMDVNDYIRQTTTLKLEQDEATDSDLQEERGGMSTEHCPVDNLNEDHHTGKVKQPLKWHGGKHYLADWLLVKMPRHSHYVQPYIGAVPLYVAPDRLDQRLWWTGKTSDGSKVEGVSEVINDLHGDLMTFYRVLKHREQFKKLQELLDLTLHSEAEWEDAGKLLASRESDPVTRAAALFARCRLSRSGGMKTFAPTVRTRLRDGRNDGVNAFWSAIEGL